ncbi:MAG: hypothetical protein QOI20_2138 [Acidimicrobiaceae bacterium]|jgi:GNAT superfamily N-acetyltransferase|nr:hypothetical protein [Acidimicrobiaceae bacterium]
MQVHVIEVTAADTHSTRRLVLREGRSDSVVAFDGDDDPGAIHLAAVDHIDGDIDDIRTSIVGVATFFPSPCPPRPNDVAYQLRGMAVLPEYQGRGVGASLLAAGVERVRAAGATLLWANARDSALGFYEGKGWKAEGDGFEYGPARLPHHVALLPL